nr:hypothetical protein Itr_chr02CG16370 [Ipomoea trifida]
MFLPQLSLSIPIGTLASGHYECSLSPFAGGSNLWQGCPPASTTCAFSSPLDLPPSMFGGARPQALTEAGISFTPCTLFLLVSPCRIGNYSSEPAS